MLHLIDKYTKLCIKYSKYTLEQIFNGMIEECSDNEAEFMADNFILFIKCGENIRKCIPEIREQIVNCKPQS